MPLTEEQKRRIAEEERLRIQLSAGTANKNNPAQKHGVPAILSFFIPGLGQLVKGQVAKGVGIFFGFIISFVLVSTVIGAVVPLIIYVWQIIDAYNN